MDKMRKQAERFGTTILTEDVVSVDLKSVLCHQGLNNDCRGGHDHRRYRRYRKEARSARHGDKEFWQKGVTACAVCDGAAPIFRNKDLYVSAEGTPLSKRRSFSPNMEKKSSSSTDAMSSALQRS